MIDLKLDADIFIVKAKQIDGTISQLPFALAQSMNTAAFNTRAKLKATHGRRMCSNVTAHSFVPPCASRGRTRINYALRYRTFSGVAR
jgi:hypothetical protein